MRLTNRPPCSPSQRGFTLITLLVVVGAIGIFVTLLFNFSNKTRIFKKNAEASKSVDDIDQMLKVDMNSETVHFIKDTICAGYPIYSKSLTTALGTELVTRVINLPPFASDIHLAAAARCSKARQMDGNSNVIYYCVQLQLPAAAKKTSFSSSMVDAQYMFGEFLFRVYDPQTTQSKTCQQAFNNYNSGTNLNWAIDVTYTLYWAVQADSSTYLTKQRTSYFVTRQLP